MSVVQQITRDLRWQERRGQSLIALIGEWRRRSRGRRELAAMGDRALQDIGVTHYDAYLEARKPFWRA
jgi:uncharacterized protein YjiS (DUF1127 family)